MYEGVISVVGYRDFQCMPADVFSRSFDIFENIVILEASQQAHDICTAGSTSMQRHDIASML